MHKLKINLKNKSYLFKIDIILGFVIITGLSFILGNSFVEQIKVYKDGECVATANEIIVELKNSILKIKGDQIFHEPKKIKNKLECFVVR